MSEEILKSFVQLSLQEKHSSSYDGDAFWILVSGFLVFFMHAGFAMLEAGSIAEKHKVNILFKNVGTVTFGGIAYFLLGYGFAYGEAGNNSFIGGDTFAGAGFKQDFLSGANDRRDFFFQFAFCVTAATIMSGAVAGRIRLEAYLALAVFVTAFVYPVVTNWVWSGTGWLSAFKGDDPADISLYIFAEDYDNACGVFDYAGSGVVHLTGGVAAFMAAWILGPRKGRFVDGEVIDMPGHNLSISTLGTFILWFGWYGFNCGSALAFDGLNVAKVAVTTSLAPAAACLTSIIVQKIRTGKYDLPGALNAILAGLVSITAGCSTVSDWTAIPIGAIGAGVYILAKAILLRIKVDDPIGAIPVHGACGIWGVIAVGLFATPEGVQTAYSCPNAPESAPDGDWLDVLSGYQMLQQLILVLSIIAWVAATVGAFVYAINFVGFLRVSEEDEDVGLDIAEHGIISEHDELAGNRDEEAAKKVAKEDIEEKAAVEAEVEEPSEESAEEPAAEETKGAAPKEVSVGSPEIVEKML